MTGITYSRGRSIADAHPEQRAVADFDAFVEALDADRAPDKKTAPYVCGPLNGTGRRCADGAMPRRWLALDADYIAPARLPDLRMWFARFQGCAWPTHSSQPEAPRERIVLALDRDATREECIGIGQALLRDLAEEFGNDVRLDSSTHRGEQPVFLPPAGVTLARFLGDPLDVGRYLEEAAQTPQPGSAPPGAYDAPQRETVTPQQVADLRSALNALDADDRDTWVAVGHALRGLGAVGRALWLDWSQTSKKWRPSDARQWDGFHTEHTGYAAVFAKARAAGWGNPASKAGGLEPASEGAPQQAAASLLHFWAHMPDHRYLYIPTRELWPAGSVDGRLPWPTIKGGEKRIRPSSWLDMHRPIEQLVWHPSEPEVITDKVMQVSGWVEHRGARVFNLYRAPRRRPGGDAALAGPWVDHVRRIYPDEWGHIVQWLAFKVRHPGEKVNHALVLGGKQGIGKDTLLEPIKALVGPWNMADVNPQQMLGRFNGWARSVVVRINEARDLGEVDRFGFYEHTKTLIAAPPDTIRVDEKHLRESYCANVCGVIITSNNDTDGLYLPADDRRHFVAGSTADKSEFTPEYWHSMYAWFAAGGVEHVGAYLDELDLAGFDPKAPPPKTAAFWRIVATGEAPDAGELRDVIERMGNPPALTLQQIIDKAETMAMQALADELRDRKQRRAVPHKLARARYVLTRNPGTDDGYFSIRGRRVAVYARAGLSTADQLRAAGGLA